MKFFSRPDQQGHVSLRGLRNLFDAMDVLDIDEKNPATGSVSPAGNNDGFLRFVRSMKH